MEFLQKRRIFLAIVSIIILAAFLRFYNYSQRFGIAHDQASAAITGRYALESFQLPLFGPFSSGGPFQTGGEWFWIVALGTAFFPPSVLAPWIFITFLCVVSVLLLMYVAKRLYGEMFAIIVGAFAAVSPLGIAQSTNLTNQTPILFFAILSIVFMVEFIKTKKLRFLFFETLAIGFASAIHIQGIALTPLILATIIFSYFASERSILKIILIVSAGLLLPWVPVFWADAANNFSNTKNMLNYFANPQSQIPYEVLGRRWLTFAAQFIPTKWGAIIGGYPQLGYILSIATGFTIAFSMFKRQISRELLILTIATCGMLIILRYTRTPLFESFFVFLHPFILLLTAWMVFRLFSVQKLLGFLLFCVILVTSIHFTLPVIFGQPNIAPQEAEFFARELNKLYPNERFAIYDYEHKTTYKSLPIVLYLYTEGKIDDNGRRLGISNKELYFPKTIHHEAGEQVYDLSTASAELLKKWGFINPSEIYHSTQTWFVVKR